jgi:hypothetical protein
MFRSITKDGKRENMSNTIALQFHHLSLKLPLASGCLWWKGGEERSSMDQFV